MKKIYKFYPFFIYLILLCAMDSSSQINIQKPNIAFSTYLGGSVQENSVHQQVVGDDVYIIGQSTSPNYPVTNGSTLGSTGFNDVVVTKINTVTGNILFSTYLGGSNSDVPSSMKVVGNEVFIVGTTASANFPVTNGSVFAAGFGNDIFFTKLNATTGAIITSTFLGGTDNDFPMPRCFDVIGNEVHIGGNTSSLDFPVTNGTVFASAFDTDVFYAKLNATTGSILTSTYLGGVSLDDLRAMKVLGNDVYLTGITESNNFPVNNGSTFMGGGFDMFFARLSTTTGNRITVSYFGGNSGESPRGFEVIGNEVFVVGVTGSTNLPVTNGSVFSGVLGINDFFYLKLNASTSAVLVATYIGGSATEALRAFKPMEVVGNEVHFVGVSNSPNYPVTNGSVAKGVNDQVYTKLNANTGSIITSTYIAGNSNDVNSQNIEVTGTATHYLGQTSSADFPTTNGSALVGPGDFTYNMLDNQTGNIIASALLGGNSGIKGIAYQNVIGNNVYILGHITAGDFPVTTTRLWNAGSDIVFAKLNLCPTGYTGTTAVTPALQSVCTNGMVTSILMNACSIPGSAQPTIYNMGVATTQPDLEALYQWQESTAVGGPFTNIPGAVEKNYTPASASVSKYYRRIAYSMCNGVRTVVQTSDVASVIVSADVAPTVNGGGVFVSCPGTNVTIGGTPTASAASGSTITSYLWTPAGTYTPNNTVSNPTVAPTSSTLYTVLVTDSKGCQQLGQASVTIYAANAGPDLGSCNGLAVRIGTLQIPVTGATYSWTSVPAGFTSSEAQPLVSPAVPTTYTLTLTVPVTGGGTCSTTDDVVVTPVAPPANNGGLFAGPDVTICSGGTFLLGSTGADAGFTYTWAPGNYLPANNIQQPTFTPGALSLPIPNPFTYYVTALKGGCIFVDSVKAYTLKANAGIDGCGPRTIGTPDATPGINETYAWSVVSGTGNFLGATNLPVVPIGASSGSTTYRLTVTLNGVSCTDDVIVPGCGCPVPVISVSSPSGCPDYSISGGNVVLTASNGFSEYTFSWSTTGGVTLSSNTGASVSLTNDNTGVVTVTATSTIDPSVFCSSSINVGNPAWSMPVFTAQDITVCPGTPVSIGQPTVAGYSYAWANVPTLNNYTISNPQATVNATTNFPVLVTDLGSGCTVRDTATVTIAGLPNNAAGNDFKVCGSATGVQLGSPAVPGVTYSWSSNPAGAIFLPNANVANPLVDIATTTTFTVVATNVSTGCSVTDAVIVTVVPSVAPFTLSNISYCPSDAGAVALPAGPAGMSSYVWSPASLVANNTSNGPTATTFSPRPQSATTFTLTVTNADGCAQSASTVLSPSVSVPDAGIDKVICLKNGGVSIGSSSNPTGGGIVYSWSPATGLSNTASPNPIFTPTVTGTFIYTLTKTEAGCSTTDQVRITVRDFSLPAVTASTICQGSSIQIGSLPEVGASYFWTPATGLSATNISNPVATPTVSTVYTVTAVGANGCVDTKNVPVNVTSTPAPTIAIADITACLGTSPTLNPVVSPAGSYSYAWSPIDGTLSDVNIANPSVLLFGVGTQSYTLTVTNNVTGCSEKKTVKVLSAYCITLPVKLRSFTATLKGSQVDLNWEVSEEIEVAKYEVEWSTTGFNFSTIGTKLANRSAAYKMVHTNPVSGKNFYRLKSIDKDGKYSYSSVMLVLVKNNQLVSIFPNPATNTVNIKIGQGLALRNAYVSVVGIDGKTLLNKPINVNNQLATIDVSSLPTGQYVFVIRTDNEIISKTVIVAR